MSKYSANSASNTKRAVETFLFPAGKLNSSEMSTITSVEEIESYTWKKITVKNVWILSFKIKSWM